MSAIFAALLLVLVLLAVAPLVAYLPIAWWRGSFSSSPGT